MITVRIIAVTAVMLCINFPIFDHSLHFSVVVFIFVVLLLTSEKNKFNNGHKYIFHWNRLYPGDFYFDYNYKDNFKKVKTEKFEGYSHPKITLETYIRKI